MDRPGPMFHYLLPQSSLFRVQSWNIMQWNNKKMGKNVSSANKMTRAILLSLLCNCVLMLSSLTVFPAPLPAFPCPPPLLFFAASIYFSLINTTRHILRTSIYIFLADKYNTAHIEDLESLAVKCLRLSAIMIMQPPFIILLVSLKASNPELCELKRHS